MTAADHLHPWQLGPYAKLTEEVPVHELAKLRSPGMDFMRGERLGEAHLHHDQERVNELARGFSQGEGLREPLYVLYGQKDRMAVLGEGYHRLAAAEKAGVTHLPVRVLRQMRVTHEGAQPVSGVEPNVHGYVPGDLKPSEIGLPVKKKNPAVARPKW